MFFRFLGRKQIPGRVQRSTNHFRGCAIKNLHKGAMIRSNAITQVVMAEVRNQNERVNCTVEVCFCFERLTEIIAVYAMDHKHYWKYKWKCENVPKEISSPKSKQGRGVSSEHTSFESTISSLIMQILAFQKTKDLVENPQWYAQHILQDCNAFFAKNLRFS